VLGCYNVFLWDDHCVGHPGRCFDSLMKPAFSSMCSSATIALRFDSSNHRRGCLTGLAFGSTLSACSTSSLRTPGMSEGHQAKIPQRSRRNSTSALPMRDLGLLRWKSFLLGPWGEPELFWSLGLCRKPDLVGIDLRWVVHYDQSLL
jgi:hypothetical protein